MPDERVSYAFAHGAARHAVELVRVEGTAGRPYSFGEGSARRELVVSSFWIMTTPVTQALWAHVAGDDPSAARGDRRPVENVSWDHLTAPGGVLDAAAASPLVADGEERVLRGGCFHNWAVHCTVSKRYAIGAAFHDGCIGVRLACSA